MKREEGGEMVRLGIDVPPRLGRVGYSACQTQGREAKDTRPNTHGPGCTGVP